MKIKIKLLLILINLNQLFCADEEQDVDDEKSFTGQYSSDYSQAFNKLFETSRKNKGNINQLIMKNPDIFRTTPEIITSRGFQYEEHSVVTDDGYILGIFRIINPYVNPSSRLESVLVWHQLSASSNLWLISTPGFLNTMGYYSESNGTVVNNCRNKLTSNLVFTLAACGYDVWLGNTRGNRYSSGHTIYPPSKLGIYDTRNTIQYIMFNTNTSCVGYIGSAFGTTPMYTLLSLIPEFEKHIKPIILMNSVAFLGNTTTSLRYVAPLTPLLNFLVIPFGLPVVVGEAIGDICSIPVIQPICVSFYSPIFGNVPSYLTEPNTFVAAMSIFSQNYVSSKILLQYYQFVLNGRFNEFDYEKPELNFLAYGQHTAPDYPIQRIASRNMVILRGSNDAIAVKNDIDHFISRLTVPLLEYYTIPNPFYNHLDFVASKYNDRLINWKVLAHLRYEDHSVK